MIGIIGAICAANPATEVPDDIIMKMFFDYNDRKFTNELRDIYNEFHEKYEQSTNQEGST